MQFLYDVIASYFCCSMGCGVMVKQLHTGSAFPSYILAKDHLHFHLLAFLATNFAPRDFVYRLLSKQGPCRSLFLTCDVIDATTAVSGLVRAGHEAHPGNVLLPFLTGILCYNGSSLFRWMDARGRGQNPKTFLAEPGSRVTRGVIVAFIAWYFGHIYKGGVARIRNRTTILLTLAEIVISSLEDIYNFDAFAGVHSMVVRMVRKLPATFNLGPQNVQKQLQEDS